MPPILSYIFDHDQSPNKAWERKKGHFGSMPLKQVPK